MLKLARRKIFGHVIISFTFYGLITNHLAYDNHVTLFVQSGVIEFLWAPDERFFYLPYVFGIFLLALLEVFCGYSGVIYEFLKRLCLHSHAPQLCVECFIVEIVQA